MRLSASVRRVEHNVAVWLHRQSLDDVAVLSSVSLLLSAVMLFGTWWYFTPLLGTLLSSIHPDISTASAENLALLTPDLGDYHLSYRKAFLATTIATIMLWYPAVRLAVRTRQALPRRVVFAGAVVLALSVVLLDFPYRLLSHDIDFAEVGWDGRTCHVLGHKGGDVLIFCGELAPPRVRTVRADAVVAHPAVADDGAPAGGGATNEPRPGSVEAKQKRSLFRLLPYHPAAHAGQ